MIIYKSIKWKNLLSSGKAWIEMDLQESSNTLIIGRNGRGKSMLMDALSFALYGKGFRDINKGQLVNSINKKDLVVELEFDVGASSYKVIRGIKPNIFEIYKDGNLVPQDSLNTSYQEYLENDLVKYNHKTFSSINVIGSATYQPFMNLSKPIRRQIVEDLIDVQIFSVMKKLSTSHMAEVKQDLIACENSLKLVQERVRISERYKLASETNTANQVTKLTERIESLKTQNDMTNTEQLSIEEEIGLLTPKTQPIEKLVKMQTKYIQAVSVFTQNIKMAQKETREVSSHDFCPVCKQNVSEEHVHTITSKNDGVIETEQQALKKAQEKLDEINTYLEDCRKAEATIRKLRSDVALLTQRVVSNTYEIERCQTEAEALSNPPVQTFDNDQLIKDHEEMKRLAEEYNQFEIQRETIKNSQRLLDDGGIKGQVIKQYIPKINKYVNGYLSAMDFLCEFHLDEEFNETIKSRYRDQFSYSSFSEGEKMKINLAILFTWRKIAAERNSAASNLLIMDEVIDSSLDNQSIDDFLTVLKTLTQNTNVIIISHRTEALDGFDRVIEVKKNGNFTEYTES